jgi:acetyl esterase
MTYQHEHQWEFPLLPGVFKTVGFEPFSLELHGMKTMNLTMNNSLSMAALLTLGLALLTGGSWSSRAAQSTQLAEPPLPRETIIYKRVGTNDLKLFVIKPPGWQSSDRVPAILIFHGGGWVWGTPSIMAAQGNYFARRGMVSILVQYRLLDKKTKAPPTMCVADAQSALRWVRAHAAELGVDPNRIAAGGGSAGGHLAAFLGLMHGLDDPQDDLTVSAQANALVLWNPVFDNSPGQWGHELVGDRYQEFSPAQNITSNAPPAIVFLGTKDKLIPVKTVKTFQTNMQAAGVRCEAFFYEGQGHGFFSKEPWRTQTLTEADKFLTSLGWIEAGSAGKMPAASQSVKKS